MSARVVGVVDYGAGNLFSVERGLRAAGCAPVFVLRPEAMAQVDSLILPGVGAFAEGMARLRERNLDSAICDFAKTGRPVLGVCLGMQFLMTSSEEFGVHSGLDLVHGRVVPMCSHRGAPVPNAGWCEVTMHRPADNTPFANTKSGTDFYFVHSFQCVPDDPDVVVATIDHGPDTVVATISAGNVHGCQFHPEVSSSAGIEIYRLFSNLDLGVLRR
jgi:imidazole glycerol-phosphate synthase subunit HisH